MPRRSPYVTRPGWGRSAASVRKRERDRRRRWLAGNQADVLPALIASLYGNGEQGAMYIPEPQALGQQVLYQDAAGTVPVMSDGDPVGLILDVSQGLERGPELNPSDNLSEWINSSSPTTLTTDSTGGAYRTMLTVGKWYYLRCTGSASVNFSINTSPAGNITTRTQIRGGFGECVFQADMESVYLRLQGAGSATITSLSIRELPGNHASQSSSAARPVYRTDGTLHWLEHDLVDDALVAELPDLGTNATLAYANASGVTILTGRTISGDTTLPQEAEMYGAIYLDRPLTDSETTQVTGYLNKRRGA